jgi:hypothetical protein
MIDNITWLEEQRDREAKLRDDAYAADDWATGIAHDEWVKRYYAVIVEIRSARERLAVMSEVLQQRIIIAAREPR